MLKSDVARTGPPLVAPPQALEFLVKAFPGKLEFELFAGVVSYRVIVALSVYLVQDIISKCAKQTVATPAPAEIT